MPDCIIFLSRKKGRPRPGAERETGGGFKYSAFPAVFRSAGSGKRGERGESRMLPFIWFLSIPSVSEQKFIGKGVSYCATCDGAFFKNKTVAVVGGGNTALEDAIYLADLAQKVYLIHRRNEFKAEAALVTQIKNLANVEIIYNAQIADIIGQEKLSAIQIMENQVLKQLAVDGLFVSVGRVPENIKFANIVQLDDFGYIVAGENCETTAKGIFVAGDCRTKEIRQLVTAAGDGAVAANHAIQYINSLS